MPVRAVWNEREFSGCEFMYFLHVSILLAWAMSLLLLASSSDCSWWKFQFRVSRASSSSFRRKRYFSFEFMRKFFSSLSCRKSQIIPQSFAGGRARTKEGNRSFPAINKGKPHKSSSLSLSWWHGSWQFQRTKQHPAGTIQSSSNPSSTPSSFKTIKMRKFSISLMFSSPMLWQVPGDMTMM